MKPPNPIAGNLMSAEATALRAYRRTLTGTDDGRNAAAPRRGRRVPSLRCPARNPKLVHLGTCSVTERQENRVAQKGGRS